jgi:hypothetical protein
MGKLKITEEQYRKLKNNLIERAIISEQTSSQIREVQNKLNSCFNAGLQVDGISGPATKAAIQKYLGL